MNQPKKRFRKLKITLLVLLVLIGILALVIRLIYGGGEDYPDLSGKPLLPVSAVEIAAALDEPVGNVAVSAHGRMFITLHPEARPEKIKLLEWKNGKPLPYPDEKSQETLFDSVLGLFIDKQDRLWTIDHGTHGTGTPRLLAFDLKTDKMVHHYKVPSDIAPLGSFLQDLQVDSAGKTVYIADASIFRKKPAIIVYDVEKRTARRVLEGHTSVYPQDWIIRTPIKRMTFLFGIYAMKIGVDGLVLDNEDQWLYYAAVSHDSIYRIRTADLKNLELTARLLEEQVEYLAKKPLSDGLSIDLEGNVYITDVEHGAVMKLDRERNLKTLVKDPRIRWADGLSFGPGNWLYLADSAIPEMVLRSKAHIKSRGPYYIFRFRPGSAGIPGR
jgi:sugar lactone lactonase YvrE